MSENWRRAMRIVEQEQAEDPTPHRYRVRGYTLGEGVWAYAVTRLGPVRPVRSPEPIVMTDGLFAHLSETLPRCAQRARFFHGGNSKVAISERRVAEAMAKHVGQRVFRCDLPAPAIGPHYHLSSGRKR